MSRSFGEKSCTISTARSTGLGHGDAVKLGETRGSVDNGDRWSEQAAASSAPATTALEDTTYLFICNGAVLFFDEHGFTRYTNWEVMEKLRTQSQPEASVRAEAAE